MRIVSGFRSCVRIALYAVVCSTAWAEPSKDLLAKMNSDEFEVRDKAYAELKVWAQKNLDTSPEQLHAVWKASKNPEVKTRCHELMKEMVVQRKYGKGRGFVGIRMLDMVVKNPEDNTLLAGVQVTTVLRDTPAEKAGLKMNDIILGVDELDFGKAKPQIHQRGFGFQQMTGVVNRFGDYIQSKQPDDTVTLKILRQGKKMDVKVTLMKRPDSIDFDRGMFDNSQQKKLYFETWKRSMSRR